MSNNHKSRALMVRTIIAMMVLSLLTIAGPASADEHLCTTYRSGGTRTEKVAPHRYVSVTIRSESGSITYTDVRRGDVLKARNGEVFINYTVCRYENTYDQACLEPDSDLTLFQIGVVDPRDDTIPGGWKAWFGAAEYPANDAFFAGGATFTVTRGDNPTPEFPGYLAPMRMSEILIANPRVEQDRPLTDAAPSVTIEWNQCEPADVEFEYARYGSESDDLELDGMTVPSSAGSEQIGNVTVFDLGSLSAGEHSLTIAYVGGGTGNGHYIDAIRLEALQR